jgi:hypothetical protein
MGNNASVQLANSWMDAIERELVLGRAALDRFFYRRYIDDTFLIWSSSSVANFLNSLFEQVSSYLGAWFFFSVLL